MTTIDLYDISESQVAALLAAGNGAVLTEDQRMELSAMGIQGGKCLREKKAFVERFAEGLLPGTRAALETMGVRK